MPEMEGDEVRRNIVGANRYDIEDKKDVYHNLVCVKFQNINNKTNKLRVQASMNQAPQDSLVDNKDISIF